MTDKTRVFNSDCLPAMKETPDKFYDLAIVDPPYGLGKKLIEGGGNHLKFKNFKEIQDWDVVPEAEYFIQLFRISKNQIIFGGNYFILPPCRGFIIWDKMQSIPNFSACEFAWSSFDRPSTLFRYRQAGFAGEIKIHPTQKPRDLYAWILNNHAVAGDKILDTHLGAGSNRIAAFDMGFDFTGYELDKDYFDAGNKRFEQHKSQLTIWNNGGFQ